MNDTHEPTPEFRAHLGWQIESALRRETRFAEPVGGTLGQLRAAVVVLAALAIGGIAVAAAGEVQESRQRNLLIESAQSDEAILRLRAEMARADLQEARRRFEVGMANRETVQDAERQLRAMEIALKRLHLDMEEIRATSSAPRNELHAPPVGQRDFVRERLALELDAARHALAAAEQGLTQVRERFEVGTATRAAQLLAEADLARARAQLQLVQATLNLRRRALEEKLSAEEIIPALRRLELTLQRERGQREIEIARSRVEEVRRRADVGLADQLELKRAEVELLEREIELQRIRRELESLPAVRK